jgi:putative SOS response-associated peptidase YedK
MGLSPLERRRRGHNARAETAADKNMFSCRRFFTPAGGTHTAFSVEADGREKLRDKYLHRLPGTPMLYMAGL